jgi:hypothetical protein
VVFEGVTYTDFDFLQVLKEECRFTGICTKSETAAKALKSRADQIARQRSLPQLFTACILAVGHELFFEDDTANQDPELRGETMAQKFRSGQANSWTSDLKGMRQVRRGGCVVLRS